MPKSKGKVHDIFVERMTELASQAAAEATAYQENGLAKWMIPDGLTDLLNPESPTEKFTRKDIGANYQECIETGGDAAGVIGDVTSLKTQGDYLAVMERGFRARHATPARCLAHAISRRKGQGDAAGDILGGVLEYVQDAIKAGQDA